MATNLGMGINAFFIATGDNHSEGDKIRKVRYTALSMISIEVFLYS